MCMWCLHVSFHVHVVFTCTCGVHVMFTMYMWCFHVHVVFTCACDVFMYM